jgi:magnesium transporter
MNLKDIKDKIVSGDLKSLLHPGTNTEIHPADVAKILDTLPFNTAYNSFIEFPEKKKATLFVYLSHFLQHKIICKLEPKDAIYILNHINSTDR